MIDNAAIAAVTLDTTDHVTWTITLDPSGTTGTGTVTYSGTSDPPDAGPVIVEPLVLTVVLKPAAETGQFNP
jgi:hypothetical protein